jgi:hypothetical protein
MKWLSGVFWIGIAVFAGVTNYAVKHVVQSLDDELSNVRRKTVAEQKQIHELNAEWTYLNQPELLADLNRRYVGLAPVAPKQLQHNIADIPLRPPPPEAAPEPQVTAVPAPQPTPASTAPPPPPPAAVVPVAATTPPALATSAPTRPQPPGSLDALFAQVAGGR